jgi:hypothetical protein
MFCYSTVIRQRFPLFSLQGMSKNFVVIDMSDQLQIKINPEVKTEYWLDHEVADEADPESYKQISEQQVQHLAQQAS